MKYLPFAIIPFLCGCIFDSEDTRRNFTGLQPGQIVSISYPAQVAKDSALTFGVVNLDDCCYGRNKYAELRFEENGDTLDIFPLDSAFSVVSDYVCEEGPCEREYESERVLARLGTTFLRLNRITSTDTVRYLDSVEVVLANPDTTTRTIPRGINTWDAAEPIN
jgi:hypothetical protein